MNQPELNSELINKDRRNSLFFQIISGILIFWYVFLCAHHYFNQRPMWNDEDCVFQSIEEFTPKMMFTEKLKAVQVFPRVYLFTIQQFSKLFNNHLLALRFFPFISMMAAFLIWLKLARYELKEPGQYLVFLLSWAASGKLIYYAAELKQYSLDTLVAAVFLMFLYHFESLERKNKKYFLAVLVSLPALGLFSYPGYLMAMFVLYNLMVLMIKGREGYKYYFVIYSAVLLSFMFLSYAFDMRLRPIDIVTRGFGDYFIYFDSIRDFFRSFGDAITNIFTRWFVIHPRIFKKWAIFFMVFSLFYIIRSFAVYYKQEKYALRSLATLAFGMLIGILMLGAIKKYPLIPRTNLFFCPVVLLMAIKGMYQLKKVHSCLFYTVYGSYIIYLGIVSLGLARLIIIKGDLGGIPYLW